MANFQRILGDDGLPYLIDTSGDGTNGSISIWNTSEDDFQISSEPPPFFRGSDMDLGYGQDMIRFREFLPERPDLISVISDPGEFAKSDSLRAQRAGYRGSDFDLYDFNASGSKLGRVALQEQKNSTSVKRIMQQRKADGSRGVLALPLARTADM